MYSIDELAKRGRPGWWHFQYQGFDASALLHSPDGKQFDCHTNSAEHSQCWRMKSLEDMRRWKFRDLTRDEYKKFCLTTVTNKEKVLLLCDTLALKLHNA